MTAIQFACSESELVQVGEAFRRDAAPRTAVAAGEPNIGAVYTALLLQYALTPCAPGTLALAGVIGRAWARYGPDCAPIGGLDGHATRSLTMRHFPGVEAKLQISWESLDNALSPAERGEEFEDVVNLLLDHCAPLDEDALWIAHAVATACMGDNHLWQDMGLPDRTTLSALLARYFSALARKNTGDMKWKKFFYKQLCERAEIFACRAPSCAECVDYGQCFGPEDSVDECETLGKQ